MRLVIEFSDAHHAALKARAEAEGRSMSSIIRRLCFPDEVESPSEDAAPVGRPRRGRVATPGDVNRMSPEAQAEYREAVRRAMGITLRKGGK